MLKNLIRAARPSPPASDPFEREALAGRFLRGNGIEIGALHNPLKVASAANVRYVDRMTAAQLREHYPELAGAQLVDPDIVDDGERLESIADKSQDFVIANHFLEHCENPILTLENLFRVLRPEGVLFLAVPDMRRTFDHKRPVTHLEHLMRDYREGPEWSRRQAYHEWATLVDGLDPETAERQIAHYMSIRKSIHFHVWDQPAFLEFLSWIQRHLNNRFDLEYHAPREEEMISILRRTS